MKDSNRTKQNRNLNATTEPQDTDTFQKLKALHGRIPKQPLDLPDHMNTCDQCEAITSTKILFMRQGLGNSCSTCGRLRRGKPYLSKREFASLNPKANSGKHDSEEKHK